MVAKITQGKTIAGLLRYNFSKVQEGKAALIAHQGFPEKLNLTVFQMTQRFQRRFEKNTRTKTNVVHISLNFSIKDVLDDSRMVTIAGSYLEKIGFGDQPYLVFKHEDANHPHLHIVTTNIKSSGERIETHNLGKTLSEQARKAVEKDFQLIEAEKQGKRQILNSPLEKAEYGMSETKAIITNIITEVMNTYKFSSVPEVKAVLAQFNIGMDIASTPNKTAAPGITYFITDAKGIQKSRGVNASKIYCNPTYKTLSKLALKNALNKKSFREAMKSKVENALRGIQPGSKDWMNEFEKELKKEGIYLHKAVNAEGRVFGLTFVNNQNRTVFKGSDIHQTFTMGNLQKRFEGDNQLKLPFPEKARNFPDSGFSQPPYVQQESSSKGFLPSSLGELIPIELLTELYRPEYVSNDTHVIGRKESKEKRRKKRKL